MTTRLSDSAEPDDAPQEPDRRKSKAAFVKPELICHGAVVDVIAQFGGSIAPNDEES